jgi:hypothetical protein
MLPNALQLPVLPSAASEGTEFLLLIFALIGQSE